MLEPKDTFDIIQSQTYHLLMRKLIAEAFIYSLLCVRHCDKWSVGNIWFNLCCRELRRI